MIRHARWSLALVLCLAGCKSEASQPSPLPSASAAPAAAAPLQPVSAAAGDVPTSEDFEQTALDQINPQNMEQELDKLEKDISQ